MSTTNRQSAAQATSQTKNEKGNVIMSTQTNKAVGFVLVNSKEVVVKSTKQTICFPAQVRMTLEFNGKKQEVAFGYSRLGGRATYVVADKKAPVLMSRADFVKQLNKYNIANMNQVQHALGRLHSMRSDEYLVAKCECCDKPVTAANMDYIQRNHAKLNEALAIEVTQFSKICYDCQRGGSKKPVNAPAKKKQAPAKQKPVVNTDKVDTRTQDELDDRTILSDITPALCAEIMALEVDTYSEIAELQRRLAKVHAAYVTEAHTLWTQASEASAKAVSHTPTAPAPAEDEDTCIVCDRALPAIEDWNSEVCPACSLKGGFEPEYIPTPVEVTIPEAAKKGEPAVAPERVIIQLGDECCVICDEEMPAESVWKYDFCPACITDEHSLMEFPAHLVMEAKAFIVNDQASEASPSQEQADHADNEEVAPAVNLRDQIKQVDAELRMSDSERDVLDRAIYEYQEELPEC